MKLNLNPDRDTLSLLLDTPLPTQVTGHAEFGRLKKLLDETGGFRLGCVENGELTRLEARREDWFHLIERVLPKREAVFQKTVIHDLMNGGGGNGSRGLKVNFHQKSFDTAERYWNFLLNQGHFVDYIFNRVGWYLAPVNQIVPPFPFHVDIETANTCNMNCPMCYRSMLKNIGQMEMGLFRKAVDECAQNNVYSVRLSWRGEALTHPRIKEMIAYATKRIKNVSFLTNAFYIDGSMADCFIDTGLAYLSVSFDGIKDIYETVRHPAKFEDSYQRLRELKVKKEARGARRPQVRVCTIWPAVKDDPKDYQRTMREVSDYMVCNPYINFMGPMKIKKGFICQYPWERI
ncbi:MAG: radical SAM protein, partial [Deltaproteobacteria bacterium]|nr:radical SAM protein [Deltaproteobacteria bacterium]